jgi:DNA-binding FadR family transcriptional regulator
MNTPASPSLSNLAITPNPLRHRRAESIAAELRALIMNGTLELGQKLPTETALCQQFNVSRTTLREAIQMLRSTGMLDVTPGRGSYVRAPALSQLLPSLQLAGRGRNIKPDAVHQQIQHLISQSIVAIQGQEGRLREPIQQLYQHTLVRNADATSCAHQEAQWVAGVVALAEQPLMNFLGQLLLSIAAESRRRHYTEGGADATLRTIQHQLRLNAALLEGDSQTALRLLTTQATAPAALPPTQQAA